MAILENAQRGKYTPGMATSRARVRCLGIDIGGTKVAAGLVSGTGRILRRARVPMAANGSAAAGLAAVRAAVEQLGSLHDVAAAGISSPGPLDQRRGVVLNPPNLPCWRDYPLARALARALDLPVARVRLENDANAAALAEARWGAGRGYGSVFYATLGTGIGAGLVLGGQLYRGRTGNAIEAGHLSLERRGPRCGCGKRGCIEALASGPALARRARARLGRPLKAEQVAAAWRAGDKGARAVLEETAELLGAWLGNIVDVLEPEVIILGGGMGRLWWQWRATLQRELQDWSLNSRAGEIPLLPARFGADAGIAGAAALCFEAAN